MPPSSRDYTPSGGRFSSPFQGSYPVLHMEDFNQSLFFQPPSAAYSPDSTPFRYSSPPYASVQQAPDCMSPFPSPGPGHRFTSPIPGYDKAWANYQYYGQELFLQETVQIPFPSLSYYNNSHMVFPQVYTVSYVQGTPAYPSASVSYSQASDPSASYTSSFAGTNATASTPAFGASFTRPTYPQFPATAAYNPNPAGVAVGVGAGDAASALRGGAPVPTAGGLAPEVRCVAPETVSVTTGDQRVSKKINVRRGCGRCHCCLAANARHMSTMSTAPMPSATSMPSSNPIPPRMTL